MTDPRERWVHLYEFGVGDDPGPGAWAVLREAERIRARRIYDPVRRRRFVARRAALHAILTGYCGACFSASDSGDVAAVAVSSRPVGVDVEVESPRRSPQRVAARMFAPDERGVLDAAGEDARRHHFHRCWVAKEAYAKGRGRGLAMRFDEFSVAAALRSPAGTGQVRHADSAEEGWAVTVETRGGVHVAVAAPGTAWAVEHRETHIG